MKVLVQGDPASGLFGSLVSESEFFDFHNIKIVQQLSGLLTLLCINVDHFNLFFIYLGKYTYVRFLN